MVRTFKVADPTACINVSVWDEPGNLLVPGDIVRLTKGYASIWRHCLTLYSGKNGDIFKVGDFCMNFNEQLNMSDPNPNLTPMNAINQPVPGIILNNGTVVNNGNGNNRPVLIPPPAVPAGPPPPPPATPIITNNTASSSTSQPKPSNSRATGGEHSKASNSNAKSNVSRGGRNNQVKGNIKNDRR